MEIYKFEHKECKTALHTGEIKEGLETNCRVCKLPFLSHADYVKLMLGDEL